MKNWSCDSESSVNCYQEAHLGVSNVLHHQTGRATLILLVSLWLHFVNEARACEDGQFQFLDHSLFFSLLFQAENEWYEDHMYQSHWCKHFQFNSILNGITTRAGLVSLIPRCPSGLGMRLNLVSTCLSVRDTSREEMMLLCRAVTWPMEDVLMNTS